MVRSKMYSERIKRQLENFSKIQLKKSAPKVPKILGWVRGWGEGGQTWFGKYLKAEFLFTVFLMLAPQNKIFLQTVKLPNPQAQLPSP